MFRLLDVGKRAAGDEDVVVVEQNAGGVGWSVLNEQAVVILGLNEACLYEMRRYFDISLTGGLL